MPSGFSISPEPTRNKLSQTLIIAAWRAPHARPLYIGLYVRFNIQQRCFCQSVCPFKLASAAAALFGSVNTLDFEILSPWLISVGLICFTVRRGPRLHCITSRLARRQTFWFSRLAVSTTESTGPQRHLAPLQMSDTKT
jgi:hypothetical protein